MNVEIISIGTELLLGDIVDSNAAYLARNLTELGFNINYINTVGDNKERIVKTIKQSLSRADIVITTGGLGPTTDDLTRTAVAESTGRSLYQNEELEKRIRDYFSSRGRTLTPNNLNQAYMPRGAEPLLNNQGTAPGILLETEKNILISLPGVPREMKGIFAKKVAPYLVNLTDKTIRSLVLRFFGIGESTLETKLRDLIDEQSNPTLALLAGNGEVKLRITAKADTAEECHSKISEVEKKVKTRAGKYIYSTGDKKLPELVGEKLREKKLTMAAAESCTGGLIGSRITDIPGSSDYFIGGITAYSNRIKKDFLGVSQEILDRRGAVSRETALKMCQGIKDKYAVDYGISVTGIAGPGGGTEQKPVGLVYIGLSSPDDTQVYKVNLNGDRAHNKWMTSQYALYYLLLKLQ